jgi:hypothetical protein
MPHSTALGRAVIVMIAAAASALTLGLGSSGCGPEPTPPSSDAGPDAKTCTLAYLGDKTKDPELELIALGADYMSSAIADGAKVALLFPPQGGRVVFVGVRATNLDPCAVKLAGAMRDVTSKQVRIDTRTINLEPADDGWGQSSEGDIASFANVPMCPNQWSNTNIYGTEYEVEVTLTDRDKRKVTKTIRVTPECSEPALSAECTCICKGGYVLGEMCDGGAPTSSSSGAGGNSP